MEGISEIHINYTHLHHMYCSFMFAIAPTHTKSTYLQGFLKTDQEQVVQKGRGHLNAYQVNIVF